MARKRRRKSDRSAYALVALMFALMMLFSNWFSWFGGGGGKKGEAVFTQEEIKKYLYVPNPNNLTILLFVASIKECPICPIVVDNVTEAVNIFKDYAAKNNLNVSVAFKVFTCYGFPQCTNKEALINFKSYRITDVPVMLITYNGSLIVLNPVGFSPDELARAFLDAYHLLKVAWKPPREGKYLLYLYDSLHKSPFNVTLREQAAVSGVKFVELGCEVYPTNCTDIRALATMLTIGLRPNDLPLAIVFKDGQVVAAAKVDMLNGTNVILQALKDLKN
ncbi:MAG: hypothetical protein GXO07_05520 [Crenarchaeota archaeon]|nr:hypothetical protein [Thermoproteota archaeon]